MGRALPSALVMHLALALALFGQQSLLRPDREAGAGWLLVGAGLVYLVGLTLWPARLATGAEAYPPRATDPESAEARAVEASPAARPRTWMTRRHWGRVALAYVAIFLTIAAYALSGGNTFTRTGVLAWGGALLLFLAGTAEVDRTAWQERIGRVPSLWRGGLRVSIQPHHWALLAIFLLALYFRVYRLAEVPADLGSDQAEKLLDVQDVLLGFRPIFFPRNTGREAFQFYLTALLIHATPLTLSHLALKVGTVLVSLFALPWTYLLGKALYGRRLGLLATLLLAISHWHVAISRVGLRFPFTAAFATPTLYYLFRAVRTNRRNDWLAAGLFLGVGLHTYIPMRIVPLLLALLVLLKLALDGIAAWRDRPTGEASSWRLSFWINASLAAVAAFLVFLPLFRFMVDRPDIFWYRVTTRSADALDEASASLWPVLLDNARRAALMFNVQGDTVFSNTIPYSPVLGWVTGALFALGLSYLVWRLVRHGDRRPVYLIVSLWLLVMPSVLSLAFPGENPSVVRTGGAIPIAMIVAALPLWLIWERMPAAFGRWGGAYAAVMVGWLTVLAVSYNADWYFHRYDEQFRRSIWNAGEMGRVVRGFADSTGDLQHAYHVAYPFWVDTRAIGINAGDINWYLDAALIDLSAWLPAHVADPAPKLYLLSLEDEENLARLRETFPEGWATRYASAVDPSKDFWIYIVPAPPGAR